ncbi:MAG TPA: thioesterase domain-containing protein [Anaerolineae bacterium]
MTENFGKLILIGADKSEQEFSLTQPVTTIGSAETNDIALKQAKLSRAHARIECSETGCAIFDLESTKGTQVNNRGVKQSNLVSGDVIMLGDAELRFESSSAAADTDATILDAAIFANGGDAEQEEAAEPAPAQPMDALVEIQAGSGNQAFFCVAARYSDVPLFRNVAHHLGPKQPFYALQPPRPAGGSPAPTNMEALAAHYVDEIRRTQPKGPYRIGGYNVGGLVAYEIAQQLQAGGVEVALLALIDTPCLDRNPLPYWTYRSTLTINQAGDTLFQPLWNLVPSTVTQQIGKSAEAVRDALRSNRLPQFVGQVVQQVEEDFETVQETLGDEGYEATAKVIQRYKPKTYSGRATLFLAAQSLVRYSDALWRWHSLVPNGLDVHTIPGGYISILKEPQVQRLAAQLKACLA